MNGRKLFLCHIGLLMIVRNFYIIRVLSFPLNLSFDFLYFEHKFRWCSDEEEHHCPQPKSFRVFTTFFLQIEQFLVISSLKNSTMYPQFGHSISNMASNPQSCVLFPLHFRIGIAPLKSSHNLSNWLFAGF
jgi:hypothetical protein